MANKREVDEDGISLNLFRQEGETDDFAGGEGLKIELGPDFPGSTPETSLPISPLSRIGRFEFGRAALQGKKRQMEILRAQFPKAKVLLVDKLDDKGIKEGEKFVLNIDGTHHDVDPQFKWSLDGQKYNLADSDKDFTQMLGESGVRLTGAVAGAKTAVGLAAPFLPATGLLAPIATVGVAIVGAGVGSLLADTVDATGTALIEGELQEDKIARGLSAFLEGSLAEVGGQGLKLGAKGVKKGFELVGPKLIQSFANSLESLAKFGDNSQKFIASKLVSAIGGSSESLARVRVDNPLKVARFDIMAYGDNINKTNNLVKVQQGTLERWVGALKKSFKTESAEIGAIRKEAAGMRLKPTNEPGLELVSSLKDEGFLTLKQEKVLAKRFGIELPTGQPTPLFKREIEGLNKRAATRSINTALRLNSRAQRKNGTVSFDDYQIAIKNIDDLLFEKDLTNRSLQRILRTNRTSLRNDQLRAMGDINPELAARKGLADARFSKTKDLLTDVVVEKTSGARLNTFLKKVMKEDGNFEAETISALSRDLGVKNLTEDILAMQAAKVSSKQLFAPGPFLRLPIRPAFLPQILGAPIGAIKKVTTEPAAAATKAAFRGFVDASKLAATPFKEIGGIELGGRLLPGFSKAGATPESVVKLAESSKVASKLAQMFNTLDSPQRRELVSRIGVLDGVVDFIGLAAQNKLQTEEAIINNLLGQREQEKAQQQALQFQQQGGQ